jgi:hypothetical protein
MYVLVPQEEIYICSSCLQTRYSSGYNLARAAYSQVAPNVSMHGFAVIIRAGSIPDHV